MLKTALVAFGALWLASGAAAQPVELTSENFRLRSPTLSGGGGLDLESQPPGEIRALGVTIGQSSPIGVSEGASTGIVLLSGFWPAAVSGSGSTDSDGDGRPDFIDNCPTTPNGPDGGTCVQGESVLLGMECEADLECGDQGACSRMQEDTDQDSIGNACECGDFNGDGFVNTLDARDAQRCTVGQIDCVPLCDTNGDSLCNTIDAREIQRLSVGLVEKADLMCDARP